MRGERRPAAAGARPAMMHRLDPLTDPRWRDFLGRAPRAGVFHSAEWLAALRETYGYQPVVYTTAEPGTPLQDGIAFCQVESWLTGRRLVSLPFSDHCDPLGEDEGVQHIVQRLSEEAPRRGWKYIELRPSSDDAGTGPAWRSALGRSESFVYHHIPLQRSPAELLASFHASNIQRKIRRAEQEGLRCEQGRSAELLAEFYRLQVMTRRRHGLPPQPRKWFENVLRSMGPMASLWVARQGEVAVAAILTLSCGPVVTYKYGCSDAEKNNLGGMQLLLWQAIRKAAEDGARSFELGRSEADNTGLVTFKDRWGAARSTLTYWRHPAPKRPRPSRAPGLARAVLGRCPSALLVGAGRLLYRHMA